MTSKTHDGECVSYQYDHPASIWLSFDYNEPALLSPVYQLAESRCHAEESRERIYKHRPLRSVTEGDNMFWRQSPLSLQQRIVRGACDANKHGETPPNEHQSVINRRNSFYYRMNKNKASVTALFRTPCSHCRAEQKPPPECFEPLFRIGGLCDTPRVAVTNIYSAASPSHESELRNALRSALRLPGQWALDACHTFLHMTVGCD